MVDNEGNNSAESVSTSNSSDYKTIFSDEVVKMMSDGFLSMYKPHLEKTKDQLHELTEKQAVLIEQLHNENLKVSWSQHSVDLIKMFDKIGIYQNKLNNVKKEIRALHEKNLKLKKRAIKLQQHKEKMQYLQNQHREAELKKEQDLIGKPK